MTIEKGITKELESIQKRMLKNGFSNSFKRTSTLESYFQ